jgi:hypothetical protein
MRLGTSRWRDALPMREMKSHMPEADDNTRARLPAAVYDLAIRLGSKQENGGSSVRLTQTGRMLRSITSTAWMSFTASQTISVRHCAFDWRARIGPLGLIFVSDALQDGIGRLTVNALGVIPLVRAAPSAALARGELMRCLAEIAMAPDAILGNADLRWRVDGTDTLAVSAGVGETSSEVFLNLDSNGRIVGAFAPDRPRSATEPFLPTLWRGRFSDYRLHRDRWVPFAGEVNWEIDGKDVMYWQGDITDWETLSAATD